MGKKESLTETGCSKQTRATWPLLAALMLNVLVVAVSCGGAANEQRAQEPAGDEEQAAVDLEHPSLGDEGAPVVLSEYADYQ